jgi:hypothetical protein
MTLTPCLSLTVLDSVAFLELQKLRGARRKKEAETRVDTFQRLTDDEKGDIVSQAIEALQTEIEQVGTSCPGFGCTWCLIYVAGHTRQSSQAVEVLQTEIEQAGTAWIPARSKHSGSSPCAHQVTRMLTTSAP